jgi:uncharacterized protein YuzE
MISQALDVRADALYIELVQDAASARTEEIDPGTLVDLDARGRVIGIEVVHPARPWPLEEILERYDIDCGDERELRAYFPQMAWARTSRHVARRPFQE